MAEAKSDLDTLDPEPFKVTIRGGETLAVREFYFGQWPKAIRLFRPVTEAVQKAGIAGFTGTGMTLAPDWAMRLPQVMDEGGEALIEFVAFAIGKPRVWFDTLGGDDGVALTKAVFEVNGDFFVRKIAPMLGLAIQPEPLTAQAAADGSTSSTSLSATDTTAETSPA